MKLLVLNFFPAFCPATSGGELRVGNLYRALSAEHEVTLLSSTDFGARREDIRHGANFLELRFPKDALWRQAYATLEAAGLSGDLSGLAFALAVADPSCELRRTARALAPQMDRVVHEFPFSEPIFSDAGLAGGGSGAGLAGLREIYNSHNFETSLLASIVEGPGIDTALLKLMRLEGSLARRAELVFATSAADAEKFRLFYGVPPHRLALCPNGFDDAELLPVRRARAERPPANARARLLFTGSAHPPNVEAARFLVSLADALPDCDVVLAGSVAGALDPATLPANVLPVGPFDPAGKRRLLAEADLFLNPVVLGSGTSLKALDALGAGLPMVSTPEGVRGLDVTPGVQAAVVPRLRFAETIRRLLAGGGEAGSEAARLAKNGRGMAERRFTWTAIAAGFAERLKAAPEATMIVQTPPEAAMIVQTPPEAAAVVQTPLEAAAGVQTQLVLALNDYPVLGATSGGMARVRGLLNHVDADVVLVSFGGLAAFELLGPGLLHVTVPKTAAHQAFETALSLGQPASANDAAAALFIRANRVMATMLPELARRAGAVVLEHCYMAPALDLLRATSPDLPVVYSAHNIEATHKPALLAGHTAQASLVRFIAGLERIVVATARLIVCCTEADARHFRADADPALTEVVVVANGCEMPTLGRVAADAVAEGATAVAGFLGSSHGPNVEAAAFILRELAPALPQVRFELIGSVCSALPGPFPTNIRLHGMLDDAEKSAAMAGWTVALNPVISGGGSSLKLPDYMAHALPSLNTPAGARGFAVEPRGAGVVAERAEFRETLAALLAEPERLAGQRGRAEAYAQGELSWQAVSAPYRERLARLLAEARPGTGQRPSLLVVTYRYTEPTLGGAEEYLVEVLRRLRPRVERLDLACIDVAQLTNHHHFATFATTGEGVTRRVGELFDGLHCLAADAPTEAETIDHCRTLERGWMREEQALMLPFAHRLARRDQPVLLSGFYWPENHDGVIRRWTSPQFSVLLPGGAAVVRLAGWSPAHKRLRVTMLRVSEGGQLERLGQLDDGLEGGFVASFRLPEAAADAVLLLSCEVSENLSPGDHRPFGVLIESVSTLGGEAPALRATDRLARLVERQADLSSETDRLIRSSDFNGWVAALHNAASKRVPAMDAAFAAVRGPHSTALQDWLASHGGDYDTVLVQGIPFDLIPSTVATLAALPNRPRIVTLPHFHADDRFYHWQRFDEAFAAADATLLFSSSLPRLLGGGASGEQRFAVVPGGGVQPDEHGDPTARERFRAVYDGERPYFLVLGRKTASKGYGRVIEAHKAWRRRDPASPDLLLIGPDEDGRAIDAEGVRYLGRQRREVIRAALAGCIALITMSESESFGIVLCEAWLFGRPVIANAACYSFRDLVRHEQTGLLVGSDVELETAMRRLAGDPALGGRLGQAGLLVVQQHFTWDGVADSVAAVLFSPAECQSNGEAADDATSLAA